MGVSEVGVERLVRIERPATGGGVGRLDDGRVVFVRHCLPGELVVVKLLDVASTFARGDAVRVIEASADRVSAPCPYAHPGGCGGCDLQHASDAAQREWKASVVREHLSRIARVDWDVSVASTGVEARGSRTRLRCAVDEAGRLSLRAARSHDLVSVDACWIAADALAEAFGTRWSDASEVELRAIGHGEPFAVVRRHARDSRVEVRTLRGDPLSPATRSTVVVGGVSFEVSAQSFWQSHAAAPSVLLDAVTSMAQARAGERVVDLFCGVGLFSVPLAIAVGPSGHVSAVESSPHAARDVRRNGDGLTNLTVREWSVSARSVNDVVTPGAVVVLDPPRTGLPRGVADALIRRRPSRVIYVSCDAATFARDVRTLAAGAFVLRDLRAFDLFPMTEHVELVGLLDFAA